jgi:hypothetical protein
MNGDTVVIPAGRNVTITSNQNLSSDFMYILVSGTLKLSGGKLSLNSASVIIVYTGGRITSSGSNSEKIWIGGVQKYFGTSPDVVGPAIADQNSGAGFVTMSQSTLPVKFTSFNIARQNNNVLVQWSTAQETNSAYFDIQRSENGNDWTSITTITAAGTTTIAQTYSYTDRNATAKILYYRLRQVDIDGKFIVTPVRMVKNEGATVDVKISAPTSNVVYVQFSNQVKSTVKIRLTSLNGQAIETWSVANPVGQVVLPTKNNGTGIYIVTVTDGQSINLSKQVML